MRNGLTGNNRHITTGLSYSDYRPLSTLNTCIFKFQYCTLSIISNGADLDYMLYCDIVVDYKVCNLFLFSGLSECDIYDHDFFC